jgi:hypothetical protein
MVGLPPPITSVIFIFWEKKIADFLSRRLLRLGPLRGRLPPSCNPPGGPPELRRAYETADLSTNLKERSLEKLQ